MQHGEAVLFGITEEAVTRICQNRARHMNSEAKLAGQSQRITATDLEDLYYKMHGRCALCRAVLEDHGAAKHPRSIRADHIHNVNRRSTFEARATGAHSTGAPIADIANVQWVCHLCNTLKQIVVASGIEWSDHIAQCSRESDAGFPLRQNADVCGSQFSRRGKRMAWMREQFAMKGHALSSYEVTKHFEQTDLEAHLATILKELKEIGWCGMRHMGQVRRAIAVEMHEKAVESSIEKPCLKDWCRELNEIVQVRHGWPGISYVGFQKLCDEEGLVFLTTRASRRTLERNATSSEKSFIRSLLKAKGKDGATAQEIGLVSQSDTFTETLVSKAIKELADAGQIERHEGRFFYCMDRKEAAKVIGVSIHKMKKYVAHSTGPAFLKTPNNTKGQCYYSVRTLYPWAEARKKTRWDKVGWQQARQGAEMARVV